jgi:triosephosphate isomerase
VANRTRIIAGNWKLNKTAAETRRTILELRNKLAGLSTGAEVVVFPPFVSLETAVDAARETILQVGAQNVFWEKSGAYTGEVSTAMLEALGVEFVLLGHSERRALFGETDATVALRLEAVKRARRARCLRGRLRGRSRMWPPIISAGWYWPTSPSGR